MKRMKSFFRASFWILLLPFILIGVICLPEIAKSQTIKPSFEIYSDYTYDMTEGREDINSFNIKRTYFGVKGSLTKEDTDGLKVNYRLTFDIGEFSDIGAKGSYEVKEQDGKDQIEVKLSGINGLYLTYLKYAYMELKDLGTSGLTLRFGQIPTPWISFEDSLVGMRWWTSSFTDRAKVLNSADRGLSLSYALPSKYGDITLSVVNGEGYKKPEDTKMKDYLTLISLRPLPDMGLLKGLMLHYYFVYGKANIDKTQSDAESLRQRMIFAFSFDSDYFLVLGQYLMTWDGFDSDTTKETEGSGYSVSTRLKLEKLFDSNPMGIFFRFDHFDPNTNAEKDSKDTIIAGPYYYIIKEYGAIGLNYTREIFEDSEKQKDISQLILQLMIKY